MTTEYHDEPEDDNSSFWNKEPARVSFSRVYRFRRWFFPAVISSITLVLIIALGASSSAMTNRLWSMGKTVSNLTDMQGFTKQLTTDSAKQIHRLNFAVERNKDQLTSVSEALKELSTLDVIGRTVAKLKCSLDRLVNNGSVADGCCPLEWEVSGTSCYLFSKTILSWDEAKDWCSNHESHLVILNTDEDWDFVNQVAKGIFYWVGLTDANDRKWEWVNQTPYVMNRRRWKPGQPDGWTNHNLGPGDEDCAHLHNDGRLNDLHCSTRLRYICQRHSQHS